MTDVPPPPPPGAAPTSDLPPQRSRRAAPNYLVRRAVAVGVVVAAIAGVAIGVGWYLGNDDGDHDPVAVDADWDVAAAVDTATGAVTLTDPDSGEVLDEVATDVGRVRDSLLVESTLVIVGARGAVGVDLGATEAVDLDPDETLSGTIEVSRPEGSDRTALLADESGHVVMMHDDPENTIATSTLIEVPRVRLDATAARATPDGQVVLFPDVGNFQSVLIDVDGEAPGYFPGVPLAVDEDRVATVLNVGAEARVTISSHDGEVLSEFTTATIAGAMLVENGLLTVSTEGAVSRVVDGELERLGRLSGAPSAGQSWVMISGDRLVMATETGTDVLDPDGEIVTSVPNASPLTGGDEPWSPGRHHALCLATTAEDGIRLVDARSDASTPPDQADGDLFVRADGCAGFVAADGTARTIAVDATTTDGDTVELGGDPAALSPDGSTAAVEDGATIVLVSAQPSDEDDEDDGDAADDEDEAAPTDPVTVGDARSIVYLAPT